MRRGSYYSVSTSWLAEHDAIRRVERLVIRKLSGTVNSEAKPSITANIVRSCCFTLGMCDPRDLKIMRFSFPNLELSPLLGLRLL